MNSKFLKWAGCLATIFALAACSSEEIADSTQLPEGKYPITFTATGLEVTPVTRATADGTWTKNDKVAVQVGSEIKTYTTDVGGESVTLKPLDAKDTFYWENTGGINVTAWSSGGYRSNLPKFSSPPTIITVPADQSDNESDYSDNDFIYAHGTLYYTGNKSLTFYHQTTKVVVHVLSGDDTPTSMTISSKMKTRELSTTGEWVAPTEKNNYGETTAITTDPVYLKPFWPFPLGKMDITLPDNKGTATTLASYKFLIVPQTVNSGDPLFTINPEKGAGPFIYTPKDGITWEAGHEYIYYITIKGSKVTATVSTSIGWTEGDAGAGSVEIE